MILDPNKNEYIGKLKDLVECYTGSLAGGLNEIVDTLDLTSEEILVLDKYFVTSKDLNLSSVTDIERGHLESLIFKYCRLDLETQALIKRQDRELKSLL